MRFKISVKQKNSYVHREFQGANFEKLDICHLLNFGYVVY